MKVYLMRGLPGAGKSKWVLDNKPNALVLSADAYHIDPIDGVYKFKPENAKAAHDAVYSAFASRIVQAKWFNVNRDVEIVVDNTNLAQWELAPYYRLAEVFGCDVTVIDFDCSKATAKARNVHGVPDETIERMYETYRDTTLPWWWKRVVTEVYTEHDEKLAAAAKADREAAQLGESEANRAAAEAIEKLWQETGGSD